VDLDRGYVCRSCNRGGGLRKLARLLGLEPARPVIGPTREPTFDELVLEEYTRLVRRYERHVAPWVPVYHVNDWLKEQRDTIRMLRSAAQAEGDTEAGWNIRADAATLTTEALAVLHDLDACVAIGVEDLS
jgi:hypothetical protein